MFRQKPKTALAHNAGINRRKMRAELAEWLSEEVRWLSTRSPALIQWVMQQASMSPPDIVAIVAFFCAYTKLKSGLDTFKAGGEQRAAVVEEQLRHQDAMKH